MSREKEIADYQGAILLKDKEIADWRQSHHDLSQKYAERGQLLIEKDKEIARLGARVTELDDYTRRSYESANKIIESERQEIERLKSMLFKVIDKL